MVVVGGGFAGLEAAFLLRMRAGEAVDIDLVADADAFVFRPNSIYVPFGADPETLRVTLEEPFRRRRIGFRRTAVAGVDPQRRLVSCADGTTLPYDFLVLATGAAMAPEEIPGLREHAGTIWTTAEMLELRRRFESVRDRARRGESVRVLFVVPPNNKCSGPLYEIVFMLETWLRREGVRERVEIVYSTYERTFIQAFGPRLHQVVTGEFAARGIDGHTEEVVEQVAPGQARFAGGATRGFDELVSFPPYVAAVRYEGLPKDERGFLQVELATRQVAGHPEIYAPGDAGDFPVKQAFLAFLQGDAVGDHIASAVGDAEFASPFDPVSMCVMEMFDKATFAQVPLRLTGDPALPVEVRPDAGDEYKVGVSPLWRIGKKMLGFYVPMRFHAGEPFHAGLGWQLMDVGLKGMVGVLAY